MSANGRRKPPRSRLEIVQPAAGPQQAAAITAALEQFLIETAPAPRPETALSAWQRQALYEGTGKGGGLNSWGDSCPWG